MSAEGLEYGPAKAEEHDVLAKVLSAAFAFDLKFYPAWFEALGHDNLRVVRRGGEVVAGLGLIDMGMYWGGRSVPMYGIAAVGVRADLLRRGVATWMMQEAVREIRSLGAGLSALFASTRPLYRKAGYEVAGVRCSVDVLAREIPIQERSLSVRLATEDDLPAVTALYEAQAPAYPGFLDRGRYIWPRLTKERFGKAAYGLLFEGDDGLEGYVYYRKHPNPGSRAQLELTDCVARTSAAWRRIWVALRDQGTMVESIKLWTAANDPLLVAFPDPRFSLRVWETWMLRVCDVESALRARGYPTGLDVVLDFDVRDAAIPDNAGHWRLRIRDGEGHIERGGSGTIRLDTRALASLYAGFTTPEAMSALDLLDAPADARAKLTAAFAGPQAWMREMF